MAEKVGEIFYDVSLETGAALNAGRNFRKDLKDTEKSLDGLNQKLGAVARAVQGFVAGLAIAATMRKIIEETRNAEQEQAQLAAVLRSTGESAGWTADKLNAMAESMAKSSTFSAGEITQAQTRLLSYANIVGKEFPEAMQATIDMAARLGMSITQSGETIGRALDKPSEGMQTLRRQGFKFGEDQIALAKKLEATGRVAEAQAIVLAELNFAYGGAARAARDTFGGAITALQNQLSELLTADGASLGSATKAVNDLTSVLGSSETKAAFDAITGWVVSFSRVVVSAITDIANFITSSNKLATLTGNDALGKMKTDAEATSAKISLLTGRLESLSEAMSRDPGNEHLRIRAEKMRAQIGTLQKLGAEQSTALKDWANGAAPPEPVGPPSSAAGSSKPKPPDATGAKAAEDAAKKAAREAEARRKQQAEQAKAYLKNLDDQLTKTQELTVFEQLMLDVRKGNVHLSEKQLRTAQGLATAIDMAKELEEARAAALSQTNAQLSAQRDLMAQISAYNESLVSMSMSDRSAQDMQNRTQITETYLNRLRDLEDQQRNALALNTDKSKEASIRKQYDDQIAVQLDFQKRALAEYDKYVLARNAKEEDWSTGAAKAYGNYLESARNAAAQSQELWTKGFQGMEDALVSFAQTGKLNFKDLANSIIADMVRIQVRAAMSSVMSSAGGSGGWAGALGSIVGGLSGGTAAGIANVVGGGDSLGTMLSLMKLSDGGYTGDGGKYEPKGIVHGGEYVIKKEMTKKLGLDFLDRLNGYSSGGYVGAVPSPAGGGAGAPGGGGGAAMTVHYAPVFSVDSRADRGAVVADMQRVAAESNKQMVAQLQRLKVLPQ